MDNKKKISLKETRKDLPFTVPDGFFDQFAIQMDAQIQEEKVPVRSMAKSWLYMVAMFAGILVLGNIFYYIYQTNASKKAAFYDAYLFSQLNDIYLMDFYMEEFEDSDITND